MKIYQNPTHDELNRILRRPDLDKSEIREKAAQIIESVRSNGDSAVKEFSRRFDGFTGADLEVTKEELTKASAAVPKDLKNAIRQAKSNIERFHLAGSVKEKAVETTEGVTCWRRSVPIEKVGLYIPGGTAPLFSTVLMLAAPARIAGCREVVLCTPAGRDSLINPAILFAAAECGVSRIFKIGGAQAIAAMALGTESVPKVFKIFGPGNRYVTSAKQILAESEVAIDMPAGPSELLILADDGANPEFVAADLLSQAEHGTDSQVILVTTSGSFAESVDLALQEQLIDLPRKNIAEKALSNSVSIVVDNIDSGVSIINQYAPEHLILATRDADSVAEKIVNAGSVFVGQYSCESAGDYASGTNHTLPTNGYANAYSGVSVDSFVKKITFQKISEDGMRNLGPAIQIMAKAEELEAHSRAVEIRLKNLESREAADG